ncbi:MAG: hypothetical protein AB7G13_11915, partial [Lautropia sp.]
MRYRHDSSRSVVCKQSIQANHRFAARQAHAERKLMEQKKKWLARRALLRAGMVMPVGSVSLAGLLSACGGGGGGGNTDVSSGGGTAPVPAPSPAPILSNEDLATYGIYLKWRASNGATGAWFRGTAFALSDRLMGTNAHIVDAILNGSVEIARVNAVTTGVGAYQAATGREVNIIEALRHPSYNRSTFSPDVGLLVSREPLTNTLPLATEDVASTVRRGDFVGINGFPGDVEKLIFSDLIEGGGFTPGISVPQASLFTAPIQAIRNFDERVV